MADGTDSSGRVRAWRSLPAAAVALAFLVTAVLCLDDYGPTLDAVRGDYPFGERLLGYLETGDERFLELKAKEPVPRVRAPHPDFELGRFPSLWVHPVGALLSAVSCRVFWTELGLVPAMSAHNLGTVLLAGVLVFVVAAFAHRRFGALAGVVAGGALFLTPSFFAHAFNNPKDSPQCCTYTFAVLAGLVALESGRTRAWLLAGGLTGLALATKMNALFLPVQLALFLAAARIFARREPRPRFGGRAFLAAALGFALVFYAASPPYWSEPIGKPLRWVARVIEAGRNESGGGSAISLEAPRTVLLTTPPIVLVLALVGLAAPGLSRTLRCFLLVSLAVPIGRNLLPGVRNFDGTRHFLEFLPMLCLAAGAGAQALARALARALGRPLGAASAPAAALGVGLLALAPPAWAVRATHPNQVAYFNRFAGGLGAQQARGNPEAADFWGNSYWQGMAWLSAHAEPEARVLVPFRDYIARCGAPVRLRPDIRLFHARVGAPPGFPFYVMHLVNKGTTPFVAALDRRDAPVHDVRVQDGSVLHVHRLEAGAENAALLALWEEELGARSFQRRLLQLATTRPDLAHELRAAWAPDLAELELVERLRPLLSPEDLAPLEEALADEDPP